MYKDSQPKRKEYLLISYSELSLNWICAHSGVEKDLRGKSPPQMLNHIGEIGWRLVTVTQPGTGSNLVNYYFERRLTQ